MSDSSNAGLPQDTPSLQEGSTSPVQYRTSYPPIFAVLIAGGLLAADYYLRSLLAQGTKPRLLDVGFILFVAAFWWYDSRRSLKDHIPPAGWKSDIQPEELKFMSPAAFNRKRVKLIGKASDPPEEHQVIRATRFSLDRLILAFVLLGVACFCPLGLVLWPTATLPAGQGELPETVQTLWWWIGAMVLSLLGAEWAALDWDCRTLMQDQDYIYDLLELPSWLPWVPERNNPIALRTVTRADPVETTWGKRCRHGTVKVYTWEGPEAGEVTYTFTRVPNHVDVCNDINAAVVDVTRYQQMYP
jgi:hypothetical protein